MKTINTGSPQGCIISAFLFAIYTNSLNSESYNQTHIIKYADDTAIIGCIEEDITEYTNCIKFVTQWCTDNHLILNANKTREMTFDFRRNNTLANQTITAIQVKEETIVPCTVYKYLGVVIDNKLNFHQHIDYSFKKANSRMYCLRILNSIGISNAIKTHIFNSFVTPTLTYAAPTFYHTTINTLLVKIRKIEKWAARLGAKGNTHRTCTDKCYALGIKILSDNDHPLNLYLNHLPYSHKLNMPFCRTSRHLNTLIAS